MPDRAAGATIGPMIGSLHLQHNDLDFRYLPAATSVHIPAVAMLRAVVDATHFFSRAGHHFILALDCWGAQGSNNPHCGPVVRHGEDLFETARGLIVLGDGTVVAETWNGTFSPGLQPIANTTGVPFDPCAESVLSLHITAAYAAGGMAVEILRGLVGPVLFRGAVASPPQAWAGSTRACVGGIAMGFVPPADTGCVEQLLARSAADARLGFAAKVQLHG